MKRMAKGRLSAGEGVALLLWMGVSFWAGRALFGAASRAAALVAGWLLERGIGGSC